jgi:hypothetical protein
MHNGTVTQGDNWLLTYLPLVLGSNVYLTGEILVMVLWDEQESSTFGGPTPNFFVSPYIQGGFVATTVVNHFATLRAARTRSGLRPTSAVRRGRRLAEAAALIGSTADERSALDF